jgi:1-acyl-sn-glycerol-3-phosphate acyltransferase
MFAILLVVINLFVSLFGIYFFDYRVDGVINQFGVIVLSLLIGILSAVVVFFAYIEIFYIIIGKRKPKDSRIKHLLAKQIMTVPLFATNTKIKVIGLEHLPEEPGFSIYANHTSMMDIPVLMYKLYQYPVAFLSKKVIGNIFSVGKWVTQLGCVLIDRENTRKGAEAINQVIKNIKSGLTMVVFPEGSRSKNIGDLLEFKSGAFKVALKSKAPLVPVSIVKPLNFKKIKWPFPKRIELVIHKPIPYNEVIKMSSLELSNYVKEIIMAPLK